VVWVQGCPLACRNCISPQWIQFDGGRAVAVDDLASEIASTTVDGLTISGGEPFAQAGALARLVTGVRKRRDLSVMCFTGYTFDHLRRHGGAAAWALLSQVDLLVDGPYVEESHDNLRWRASSNQRIHQLSQRHAGELDGPDTGAGLEIEVLADGAVQWLGVPSVAGFRTSFERALGVEPRRQVEDR
jgi:anaerobic ribonucleoside-triphosphate reductase activating protein